jgi:hypothetical protein
MLNTLVWGRRPQKKVREYMDGYKPTEIDSGLVPSFKILMARANVRFRGGKADMPIAVRNVRF